MDFLNNEKVEHDRKYLAQMRPIFNKKALFSDTTANFVEPMEPKAYGKVTIWFRTGHCNVDGVNLVTDREKVPMVIGKSDKLFDYYKCELTLNDTPFYYTFIVESGRIKCLYDAKGVTKESEPRLPFCIVPGFTTPNWAKGAVIYQIYTERFCNGDPNNDVLDGEYFYVGGPVRRITDWNKVPECDDTKEFYGGDLQGVINKLDYLKDLGIDVIYFNPLFVSPSNHKYDSQDYEHIDPHFGTIVNDGGECLKEGERDNRLASKYITRVTSKENLTASDELFCKLVKEAHARGIRVILDGVFNHCGSFNKWMDRERIYENCSDFAKGAYIDRESPYRDYFDFRKSDNWPYNGNYDGWWGYDTLPKLNYEASQSLYQSVLAIAQKWVSSPFNADGWRLDVAADLGHSPEFNHRFYQDFRRAVKDANPEAVIIAEHYGNPESWLRGKEWDSIMNYDAFMEPVTWFLTGMEKHSDDFRSDLLGNSREFFKTMVYGSMRMTTPSLQMSMNQLSNHDHSRFLTRTNHKVGRVSTLGPSEAENDISKAVMRLGVVIQMTWPGAPALYYGDEAGLCGFTDPDNRRTYPWGHEDWDLIQFHKEMIRIHKQNSELIHGSMKELVADGPLLGYARFVSGKVSIVLVNQGSEDKTIEVPVWEAGVMKNSVLSQIMCTNQNGYSVEEEEYPIESGKILMHLAPESAVVLCTKRNYSNSTILSLIDKIVSH